MALPREHNQSEDHASLLSTCLHGPDPVSSTLQGQQMVSESRNGCSGSLLLVAAQLGEPGSFRSHRADCSLFRQCVYFRGDSECDSSTQQVHTEGSSRHRHMYQLLSSSSGLTPNDPGSLCLHFYRLRRMKFSVLANTLSSHQFLPCGLECLPPAHGSQGYLNSCF